MVINADSTHDTKLQNDLPRPPTAETAAQIGDSITVTLGGDRIKVTLLAIVDPAEVDNPRIDSMFDRLRISSDIDDLLGKSDAPANTRYAAIQVKLRNLDLPVSHQVGIVHVQLSGALVDANGKEHRASMTWLKGSTIAVPPQRGEPSAIGSIAFRVPDGAVPKSYVLSYSGNQYAAWTLRSDRADQRTEREEVEDNPLEVLKQGVEVWNAWRKANPRRDINLAGADLRNMNLEDANLSGVNLNGARFHDAELTDADLRNAFAEGALFNGARLVRCNFAGARLAGAGFHMAYADQASFRRADLTGAFLQNVNAVRADFREATLRRVDAIQAGLAWTRFVNANLREAKLAEAIMLETDLQGADFTDAEMNGACLADANISEATLHNTSLVGADLHAADLSRADVRDSDLSLTSLVSARLEGTVFSNCRIYGISAWNIRGQPALQEELVITATNEGRLTVNDLEIAQFIYLLLNYKRLQTVFNSMTERGVLLLGRFGGGGIELLRQIAARLRDSGYIPIIFEFERPKDRNLTETVKTLVGLSRFVIVDLSGPSVPQELTATVPSFRIPFVPILQKGVNPYAMFADFLENEWVLKPIVEFTDVNSLLEDLPDKIVAPAEARVRARQELLQQLFSRT